MKWWCLLLALGLLQVAVFLDTAEAKRGRDTDGDGTPDNGQNLYQIILKKK
jgi:hypothetical protein